MHFFQQISPHQLYNRYAHTLAINETDQLCRYAILKQVLKSDETSYII